MILEIFGTLIAISLFLMWFGFRVKIRLFSIVGVSILLILSAWVIFGCFTNHEILQYKVGTLQNYTYVGNTSNIASISTMDTYSTYNDGTTFWIGLLMTFVSIIGMILIAGYEED